MPDPIDFLRQLYKDATDKKDVRAREEFSGSWTVNPTGKLPPHMVNVGPDLPPVARAPMYRPQTEVLGGPEFARSVETFFNAVPEMRGRTARIQHGPNDPIFSTLRRSGFGDNDYAQTNLLGTTNLGPNNNVTINPRLRDDHPDFHEALSHEMGHVAGMQHGQQMEDLVGQAQKVWPRLSPAERLLEALKKAGIPAKIE